MEVGIAPVLCGSGAKTGRLRQRIEELDSANDHDITVLEGVDFAEMEERGAGLKIDLLVGNSKGFAMSRKLNAPLVRVGFPIHDRIDGPGCCTSAIAGPNNCSIASPTP